LTHWAFNGIAAVSTNMMFRSTREVVGTIRYTLALALLACAPAANAQLPAQPLGRQTQPSDQNQLDGNQALFTVLAAINVAGYDDQINAASTNPYRHQLRARFDAKSLDSVYELKRFVRDHKANDPKAELSRYISYGLLINGPPDFGYRDPDMVRPADASALEGLSPLLAAFYREANLEEEWQRAQPYYEQVLEAYHEPVARAILGVNGYLRNTTSGYLGRRFQIYVDLLGAPNQVQTRSYQDDTFVVVTPSAEPQIDGIRHAYLHYLIDPLGFKFAEEIQKKHALGDYAQGAGTLAEVYKSDFVLLATESVIKAVESRMDRKPALVDQAMRGGYVLTAALAEQLAVYEKQEVAMRLYFPNLFTPIDMKREQKRMADVEFDLLPMTRVVRPAQTVQPPELTGAAKTLEDADKAYTDRQLDRAKEIFLSVLDQTEEKSLHARAYYGLARIAILQRDPETGDSLFRKVLALEPDADTKSWSLLYLGRLADSQGDRDQAVEQYKAALAVEGAPGSVRQAAQKGLDAAFGKDSGQP
jgi:tetratricopeptide (TPR) repeat protein